MECQIIEMQKNMDDSLWNDDLTDCFKEVGIQADLTLSAITDRLMRVQGIYNWKNVKKSNQKYKKLNKEWKIYEVNWNNDCEFCGSAREDCHCGANDPC